MLEITLQLSTIEAAAAGVLSTPLGRGFEHAELVNQAYVHCCEKLGTYKPHRGSMRTWVYQVARRHLHDWCRRERGMIQTSVRAEPGAQPRTVWVQRHHQWCDDHWATADAA